MQLCILLYCVLSKKKREKHKEALAQLRKGDRVILSGGIEGTVEEASSTATVIRVAIAPGTVVRVYRDLITEIVNSVE